MNANQNPVNRCFVLKNFLRQFSNLYIDCTVRFKYRLQFSIEFVFSSFCNLLIFFFLGREDFLDIHGLVFPIFFILDHFEGCEMRIQVVVQISQIDFWYVYLGSSWVCDKAEKRYVLIIYTGYQRWELTLFILFRQFLYCGNSYPGEGG